MSRANEVIVETTSFWPCDWDDLLGDGDLFATIYTKHHIDNDQYIENMPIGITRDKYDGVYDIVVDVPILTIDVLRQQLAELSKITKKTYRVELTLEEKALLD